MMKISFLLPEMLNYLLMLKKMIHFFGKIYLINFNNGEYKLVAKGTRDTQGAYWYEKDKKLFMTEHGPQGGDEINILSEEEMEKKINFGWPIATYGELGPTPIKKTNLHPKIKIIILKWI